MSSTYLKLISVDPDFTPNGLEEQQAKALLKNSFGNSDIDLIKTDNIEFVDQGENFENLSCNYCGQNIDVEIWQDAMDEAYKTNFRNLSFVTPCCHQTTSLNALLYHWPAGFAKFVIAVSEPPVDISSENLNKLEEILDTKIRKIWAHY